MKSPPTFDFIKTLPHLQTWTEQFLAQFGNGPKRFAYDTETTALSIHKMQLIGMSFYSGTGLPAYIQFNFKTQVENKVKVGRKTEIELEDYTHKDGIDFEDARPYIEKILEGAEAITANGKFDTKVLRTFGLPEPKIVGDCNMAAYLYDNTWKGGLKEHWQHYMKEKSPTFEEVTGMKAGKIDWREVNFFEFGRYGAKDAYMTWELEKFLWEKLDDMKLLKCYENLEIPLIPEVANTEYRGVKIDTDFLDDMGARLKQRADELEREIYGQMGCKINLNSGKQLAQVLFDQMKLPVMGYTGKGDRSTDEAALKNLAFRGHDIALSILQYRKAKKMLGTYVEGLLALSEEDGRVRGNFNQSFTDTGRFSCVAADTMLLTDNGELRIGDLIPDRPGGYELPEGNRPKVLTHTGEYQEITHAINKGQEMMYEVELEDGKMIQCTENHKFLTNFGWLILKDILSLPPESVKLICHAETNSDALGE